MKNLMFIFLLLPSVAMVQPNLNLNGISKAISAGDAVALSQYFDSNIEISILDEVDVYNKAEAVKALKAFFSTNKPKSYNPMHKGTSKGADSQYSIGNLVTANSSYRVYVYLKMEGSKQLIQELRFDKE